MPEITRFFGILITMYFKEHIFMRGTLDTRQNLTSKEIS